MRFRLGHAGGGGSAARPTLRVPRNVSHLRRWCFFGLRFGPLLVLGSVVFILFLLFLLLLLRTPTLAKSRNAALSLVLTL